ncbi:MAG: T9SS type A sorting domain-containing protein, partial [Rhodothermales bacterium]|nr:T9SS type A sorting domain-containing protein [Rhodothermales bacterium]
LVLFAVDLSPFEDIGLFDQARGDTLWVFGGFNGWNGCPDQNPDDCLMGKVPGEDVFEAAIPITQIPGTNVVYKYFLDFNDETFMEAFGVEPPSGWEEAHATGTNRFETFSGDSEQDLGVQFFNDVTPGNVIPDGATIDVTFEVDMTAALTDEADPFEPAAGDSVTIRLNDPIWAFTQGIVEDPRGDGDFPLLIDELVLEDDDGDDVYTGTYTVAGPTYDALTFRFAYGQGTSFVEEVGTDTNVPGRNRVVYLDKNPDGTYVAEQTITATFDLEAGPLPFETNPEISTAIEVIDDEVPSSIFLGQNYPNPFNPTTTFEYAIGQRQQVRLVVYDLLGRAVATLVDGLQPAATYQVTFDASQLASGVYLYRLETETATVTKRMLLIK